MKQLLIIAAIIFSSVVNGQTSKEADKKIKVPVDTTYVLSGAVPDFQILYKAVNTPGKITREELDFLVAWLRNIQMIEVPKKPKQ